MPEGAIFMIGGKAYQEGTAYAAPAPPRNSPRSSLHGATLTRRAHPSRSEFYRLRFESSVMGNHSMLPPPEIDANLRSVEDPSPYPSGPNTSFHDPTPMPARFTEEAVPALNKQRQEEKKRKQLNPTYHTTTSEIGSLDISASDLPMRWYGLRGEFTNAFFLGGNDTKSKVNTGLNAAMDRSSIHHTMDQGWSGHMGIYDYNIANLTASKYVKPSYK